MKFESKILNNQVRDSLKGKFLQLSDGITHYQLSGKEDGKLVVLIHGLTSASFIWNYAIKFLSDGGFRVLVYDLFGRGYSDRPKIHYDQNLFEWQLYELLSILNIQREKISLVGLSMGGLIASNFALKYQQMVSKISLLAPAGFPMPMPFTAKLMNLPIINQILFKMMGHRSILAGLKHSFYIQKKAHEWESLFQEQMVYAGYGRAILSTLLHMPLTDSQETYKSLGKLSIPIQLLWGTHDQVIPYSISQEIRKTLPQAEFHSFDKAGHLLLIEHPNSFHKLLFNFLDK